MKQIKTRYFKYGQIALGCQLQYGNTPVVISGCIGPGGDGYNVAGIMTADEAQAHHCEQIKTFSETEAERVGRLPHLNVFGGCCGTDHRHIAAIGRAVSSNN